MDDESPDAVRLQVETVEDDRFGTFEKNSAGSGYATTAEWMGTEVELDLLPAETGEGLSGLSVAKELWDDQEAWNERIQQFAVEELLELRNVAWVESDDDTVTAEEFRARMEPKTVTVDHGGAFTFWHHGNDLFFDHSILVSGTLEDGITDAYL